MPLLSTCSLGLNPLFKAQKRLIDEPREEAQKKRKVSGAEEEKDEQRFALEILKAPFYTWNKGNCSTCKGEYATMRKINVCTLMCSGRRVTPERKHARNVLCWMQKHTSI